MELKWSCVTHRLHLSLLMCCHKAAASSSHERPRESSVIISSGAKHMNVWLLELLCDQGRNYPDSLWLGSFRLSASLCVRLGARAGCGASGCPPCPELRACRFPSPLALWLWDGQHSLIPRHDSSVMAMSTVNDFTLRMRCWLGPSWPLIDWPSFTARRGLLIGLQLPADTVTLMEENYCCLVMH